MDPEAWRWVWLALAVGGVVGEMATPGAFFLLPFGLAAAIACVLAFVGVGVGLQWLVFVAAAAAALLATRPLARRLDRAGPSGVGSDRWVGKTGVVLQPIGRHDPGLVRVGGEEWRAESREGVALGAGSTVLVVDVVGTRLVVLPLELVEGD